MSPRSPEQNEKIREERLQQILKAAVQVYLEKGLHASDITDIAKKAGLARGLVYYYYKDKNEIFRAMYEQFIRQAKDYSLFTLNAEVDLLAKLRAYAGFFLVSAKMRPHMVLVYRNMWQDIPVIFGDEAPEILANHHENTNGPLIQLFEQGIAAGRLKALDPKVMSSVFWGGLDGGMDVFLKHKLPSQDETDELIENMVTMILDGITMPNSKGDERA
ncbi:TetR/AcrR family transcriptional regulator [Paenibacillus filicis]|uniref:TetR/AcrR family transcriptional regulator n=1 Tax=Paenibacillus filicis TaxID=669464 RepID=A0ABU9DQB0_9BACL